MNKNRTKNPKAEQRRLLFCYTILKPLVIAFLYLRFGYRFKKAKKLPDSYIVLSNHVTDFDPLFVHVSFPKPIYFVASEHISRWKNAYKFIKFAFEPILRPKGTLATGTVMEILRKVKKGGRVAIFAEGMRSWDGCTNPIAPSTAKLIKSAKCGLVTYKLTGGYFVSPGWSEKSLRRGPISGAPVGFYSAEELEKLSVDEIYEIICRDLSEDAYQKQLAAPKIYHSKKRAHRLENLLFHCENCGSYDSYVSTENTVRCQKCDHTITVDDYGMLTGGKDKTVKELSDRMKRQTVADVNSNIAYTANSAVLSTVKDHVETVVASGEFSISPDGITCSELFIPMKSISDLSIHGKHALVFSADKNYYEAIIDSSSNAYKFFLYYRAYKNII